MCVTQACIQNWINLTKIVRGNLVCTFSSANRSYMKRATLPDLTLHPNIIFLGTFHFQVTET